MQGSRELGYAAAEETLGRRRHHQRAMVAAKRERGRCFARRNTTAEVRSLGGEQAQGGIRRWAG